MGDAEHLAAHLAHQLARLEGMRNAATRIMARDQKGRDFFVRGAPEFVPLTPTPLHVDTLEDLTLGALRVLSRNWRKHA